MTRRSGREQCVCVQSLAAATSAMFERVSRVLHPVSASLYDIRSLLDC